LAGQFGSTSDQVKGGKLFGDFMQYGYDTAPVTGASLHYAEGKAVNPNVPAAVVKQLSAQRSARLHGPDFQGAAKAQGRSASGTDPRQNHRRACEALG
jgi:hypothetical protein